MKKAIACAAMLLALTGCKGDAPAPDQGTGNREDLYEVTHKLQNGRTVTCLLWDTGPGYDSGMSCDWANAK